MREPEEKVRFCVDPKGICVKTAVVFMALSMIFRVIGCWGLWKDDMFLKTQILLPLASCALFVLCLLLFGRRALWTTSVPVLFGVVFFIIKSFSGGGVLMAVVGVLIYVLAAVLYTGTVFGAIKTKWLLVALFALAIAYLAGYKDRLAVSAGELTLQTGLQELSVLCMLTAMLFTSIAIRKKPQEGLPPDLPKIKDPKVIRPERKAEEAPAMPQEEPEQKNDPEFHLPSEEPDESIS